MNELSSERLRRPPAEDTVTTIGTEDEESQMRKALGLLGEPPRHRSEPERSEPSHRVAERLSVGGGLHRRRFVQDGDVPVTVLRRDGGHEPAVARPNAPGSTPVSSRLQRVEASLAAETATREKAERLLHEAQAALRDLQTKIGHAELARTEAVEGLRQLREAASQVGRDTAAWQERVTESEERARLAESALDRTQDALTTVKEQLQEEKRLRQAAEKSLRTREAVRCVTRPEPEAPELAVEASPAPVRRLPENVAVSPAIRRRRAAAPAAVEQEPVKWWLDTPASPKRRRRPE